MVIRFDEQVLIGFRVYAAGEVVDFPSNDAERLIRDGVASLVREATDPTVKRARRATGRGASATRNS